MRVLHAFMQRQFLRKTWRVSLGAGEVVKNGNENAQEAQKGCCILYLSAVTGSFSKSSNDWKLSGRIFPMIGNAR